MIEVLLSKRMLHRSSPICQYLYYNFFYFFREALMTTYEVVLSLCHEHGTNPASVEKAAGLSNGSIGSWKRYSPSSKSLRKIADFFDVPIEYLLTGVMPEQTNETIISSVIKQAYKDDSPARLQLIKRIHSLTPEDCQKVLQMIDLLFPAQ